jgi:hypothetical protein
MAKVISTCSKFARLMDKAGVRLMPNPVHAGMWRVLTPDGQLSDLANLTWAKDAARSLAARLLKSEEPPVDGV